MVLSTALTIGAVVSLVLAWWYPSTPLCAVLGWTATLLWCAALIAPEIRLRRMYIAGIFTYCGGFYWLLSTIADFGGFPPIGAATVFALYAAGSAVQFLLWGFIWTRLPQSLGRLGLTTPISWLVAHRFWIKIFPWDFGHTQIAFLPFAQIANVGGVTLVSLFMLWVSEVFVRGRSAVRGLRLVALLAMGLALSHGWYAWKTLDQDLGAPLKTTMIQGNVSLERKHDVAYFTVNRDRYLDLSREISEPDKLIIWPETTITEFISANAGDARFVPQLPFLNDGSAFLVGSLTAASRSEYYNSSVLVRPDASLAPPYHKRILMPFGEYTPFAEWFPWLRALNGTAGDFSAGKEAEVLTFTMANGTEVRVSPLICYEDVVPAMASEATARGAGLLVNQTNDAWFGDTVAPYQHHMIASFRAIENRRYLLRSTNTGITAVVDPLGRTLASLPPFVEGILPMEINQLSIRTWYTSLPIETIWFSIAALTLFLVLADTLRKRGKITS